MKIVNARARFFFVGWCALSAIIIAGMLLPEPGRAAEKGITGSMQQVYRTYSDLIGYLYPGDSFVEEENAEKILSLVRDLRKGLHSADNIDHKYSKQVGFVSYLDALTDMLRDTEHALKKKRLIWARWRLRTVANHCQTCHVTYGSEVMFRDPELNLEALNDYERGEVLLATRQFANAEKAFYKAALKPPADHHALQALRLWLVIYTRIQEKPAEAIKKLNAVLKDGPKLLPFEKAEIDSWIASLEKWKGEKKSKESPLEEARRLLTRAVYSSDPLASKVGTVELLRATALLHRALERKKLDDDEQADALYLLGLGYSKLSFFFVNELPEELAEIETRVNRQIRGNVAAWVAAR